MDNEFENLLKKSAPVMSLTPGGGRFGSHSARKPSFQLPTVELIAAARREGNRRAEVILAERVRSESERLSSQSIDETL